MKSKAKTSRYLSIYNKKFCVLHSLDLLGQLVISVNSYIKQETYDDYFLFSYVFYEFCNIFYFETINYTWLVYIYSSPAIW